MFVVDKSGKVLLAEPGSPDGTVSAVKKIVEKLGSGAAAEAAGEKEEESATDEETLVEKPVVAAAPVVDGAEVEKKEEEKKVEDKEKAEVADEVADTAAKLDA